MDKLKRMIMEQKISYGKRILLARQQMRLSQMELADKCHLHVRTIQRIENEEVILRLFTLRIISEALGLSMMTGAEIDNERMQLKELRNVFEKRKHIRLLTFAFALFIGWSLVAANCRNS